MNVKRFTARSSRDALVLVRQSLGEDAVVLSTKPCAEGVEVLAMAPEGMRQIERMASETPAVKAEPRRPAAPSPATAPAYTTAFTAAATAAATRAAAPARSRASRSAARVDPA